MKITAEIIEHNGGGSANVRIALTHEENDQIERDGDLLLIKAANAVSVLINAIAADLFAEETDNAKADAFTELIGTLATDTRNNKDYVSTLTLRKGTK